MRNYSLVSEMRRRVVARNSRNKANMAKHKVITFVPIIAVSLLSNGIVMMWKIQQAKQDDAEFIRRINPAFIPVTGLKCSYGKISGDVAADPKRSHQWCATLTPNNTKTMGRMTCHCFQ